ncbi:CYTH domain-containing protein [Patiriisocius marinus]|uniref:CYTH domain-containing protein n=1 Tax=Patiriisocius marinus TaxID=1397112 RepID=A0A5J4J213_9FLAO|nr:CYTH domain-containing protein [Patiriisocius marinus]GER58547.1 CYTH domain-containing protein [Patiriisocius marinus]
MIEIERKFLVKNDSYKELAFSEKRIVQGFLNTHPERTVRVRIKGEKGFLTIKGKGNSTGTTRFEWEKEIALPEAEALLKLCEEGVIAKKRYEVKVADHIFEVDEFYDNNKGLTIAEVELTDEQENFLKPDWVGVEVTGEIKYYNSQLSRNPYKDW